MKNVQESRRLTPRERANPLVDPERAWALLMKHQDLVFGRARWHYSKSMGRPVRYVGKPFEGEWQVVGEFLGRSALDFIEETFAGVLETAAHALELYSVDKGAISSYVDRAVHQAIVREFRYWQATSSRQPIDREDGGLWELNLVTNELVDEEAGGRWLAGVNGIDQDNDIRLSVDPIEDMYGDPENGAAVLAVARVQGALTPVEFEALERHAGGQSYTQIAEDMGLTNKSAAQRAIQRAVRKSRQTLEGSE